MRIRAALPLGLVCPVALALALAVPARAADPVVAAAGDIACDPASTGFNAGAGTQPPAETPGRCHMGYTGALIAARAPSLVLGLGDEQNNNGTLAKYQQSYDPAWGGFKAITRPVPGNHEYASSDADFNPDAPGYVSYFRDQLAPFGDAAGDPRRGWYSYDVATDPGPGGAPFHWHVVALNSECASGAAAQQVFGGSCAQGSPQEQWLRADLERDTSSCTLAYWHHPYMTSNDRSLEMRPVWQALHDDYGDLVLSGHRHTYERFAPQDADQQAQPDRGIRQFVAGTGGEVMHPFVRAPAPNSEVRDNSTFGALFLTLHGPSQAHPLGWYEWRFEGDAHSGSTFADQGSADCVGPGRSPAQATAAAATGAGQAAAPPARAATADRIPPRLSRVSFSRARFRVAPGATAVIAARGTVLRFVLSEPAATRFAIDRRRATRGRVRWRRAGTLRRSSRAGRSRLAFSGRIGRRALPPGRYRLTLSARDGAGNPGRTRALRFTVVR